MGKIVLKYTGRTTALVAIGWFLLLVGHLLSYHLSRSRYWRSPGSCPEPSEKTAIALWLDCTKRSKDSDGVHMAEPEKLSELDEKGLREDVLLPLLTRLGCKAPTICHGPQERGKDIIAYTYDLLGQREHLAVVAKAVDLSGSVSSSKGLREVVHQVQQCFDEPYEDLFGMTRVSIDRVWIVTSKRILSGAETSIFSSLEKNNLRKLIRFISGERLADLLDENYPAFWDQSLEPANVLREQKARLARFCQDLLSALGGNQDEIKATLNAVLHSYSPPKVIIPSDRTLTRLSPYRVELDSIPEPYTYDFQMSGCGSIREAFFAAKQKLYYAMFDVDELMENYGEVIDETDPKKFVDAFQEKLDEKYPFFRRSYGRASDADQAIGHLSDGLTEFMELQTGLKAVGRWEWATALVASVSALEPDIKSFLQHLEKDEFTLYWPVDNIRSTPVLRLEYTEPKTKNLTFITKHTRNIESFGKKSARPVTAVDITVEVQREITEYLWKLTRKSINK